MRKLFSFLIVLISFTIINVVRPTAYVILSVLGSVVIIFTVLYVRFKKKIRNQDNNGDQNIAKKIEPSIELAPSSSEEKKKHKRISEWLSSGHKSNKTLISETANIPIDSASTNTQATTPENNENTNSAAKQSRRIFISYCWKNSKQANPSSTGNVDPRDISKRIEQMMNEKCWIDFDTTNGGHAVFSAIQIGINQAEVVIACVSDEFVKSDTCGDELTYARKTLKKPIIPIVVGEGMEWQNSWAGLMLAQELYIDFREPTKFNSNMDMLIGRLMKILSSK